MKTLLNTLKVGLENFHPQYGKLLGVGKKTGVAVYESFFGGKRVLTSLKEGKVFKQVATAEKGSVSGGNYVKTTVVRNFETGDTFKRIQKGAKRDGIFRIERQEAKTGNWEYFERSKNTCSDNSYIYSELEYGNYDVEKGQFIEFSKPAQSGYESLRVGGRTVSGEMTDYVLPNGSVIPKGVHKGYKGSLCWNTMEENLGEHIFSTLNRIVRKLGGGLV